MSRPLPASVAAFLSGDVLAVAGVSRSGREPANAILRRLRDTGHTVFAVNPAATVIDNEPCYPDIATLPQVPHGVVVCTTPDVSARVAADAVAAGIRHVWLHRSFGDGSVSDEAITACRIAGTEPIVGGCPLMFDGAVDIGHRCMRWWLQRSGRVPS